jgi:deoxyribodipyrimidine photo-lyase
MKFSTSYNDILEQINRVDPVIYGKTRNFINGAVTYLSPYLSRGIITLPQVKQLVMAKGYTPYQAEKFLQELAWREYYQRVWCHFGDSLFTDIKQPQQPVRHYAMIKAVQDAATGIDAIDAHIRQFYETGYLHNHVRMYVAGITCNLGQAHWLQPARWMYYHLLDGDLASNTCSWQWVAGSFSSKKYIANQENVNKYLFSRQRNTFLDREYDIIFNQPVPDALAATVELELTTPLPVTPAPLLDYSKPLLLYNSYNLNVEWRKDNDVNRLLLLEPAHFDKYPVSAKVMQFILDLASNIEGLQIFTGGVATIPGIHEFPAVYSITHPLTAHYPGIKDPYWWMFPQVTGYHNSFFNFWKQAKRFL